MSPLSSLNGGAAATLKNLQSAAAASSARASQASSLGAPAAPPTIMSVLQDFLKQVLDFALTGSGDQSVVASAHLRLKLLVDVTQTMAPVLTPTSVASNGTGTNAAAAMSAAAVAKLGTGVSQIGSQLA